MQMLICSLWNPNSSLEILYMRVFVFGQCMVLDLAKILAIHSLLNNLLEDV
jgi:hypothetical protein